MVSLNSRLESNTEEEKGLGFGDTSLGNRVSPARAPPRSGRERSAVGMGVDFRRILPLAS